MKSKSFSKRYPPDHDGPRYGPLFREVRRMTCWLSMAGYDGPGHEVCGLGVQGGHTAHHTGRDDAEGLLPGCGAAHDLYAGYGGSSTVEAFRGWLKDNEYDLQDVALGYVEKARGYSPDMCD